MPIRLGIIGADQYAREIVDVLMSIEQARIVAICDRDLARAESLARRCKARAFRDAKAMLKPPTKRELARELARLKSENADAQNSTAAKKSQNATTEKVVEAVRTLDAILILTTERNRNEAISFALQSGCDVFAMSPLAFSLAGAKQLIQFAQDNRARIWTSHDARFSPSCEHARKLLSARGAKPLCVSGSWKMSASEDVTKAARDNVILTSSTRCVDALRFLGGEIKSVYARLSIGNITLSIEFANGVVGAIVLGEDCENVLYFQMSNQRLEWRENAVVTRRDTETQHIEYSNGTFNAQRNELRAWLQSVESGRRTLAKSKPEDAIQNLRVALAIMQSIKTNKPVRFGV